MLSEESACAELCRPVLPSSGNRINVAWLKAKRSAWRPADRPRSQPNELGSSDEALLTEPDLQGAAALRSAATSLVADLREETGRDELLRRFIAAGQIGPGSLALRLDAQALGAALAVPADAVSPSLLTLEAPLQMRRRGVELKLVAGERSLNPDATLLRTLAKAHGWAAAIRRGEPVIAIARRENRSETFIRSRAELAFLSPRIQEAIVQGRQPVDLTLERLLRTPLPLAWAEQERVLGFGA